MSVEQLLGLPGRAPRQYPAPQVATVLRADADGLYVTLTGRDDEQIGPCSWSHPGPHTHTLSNQSVAGYFDPDLPPQGTRCLVLFAGSGIEDPWVVQFDRWPS